MKYGGSIPADAKIVQLDLDETLIGQNRSAPPCRAFRVCRTGEAS
jgi:hypothetical protein